MVLKVELVLTVYKQENEPQKKKSVEIKLQKVKNFQNLKITK